MVVRAYGQKQSSVQRIAWFGLLSFALTFSSCLPSENEDESGIGECADLMGLSLSLGADNYCGIDSEFIRNVEFTVEGSSGRWLTRRGQANVDRTCHTGEFESFGDERCLVALTENFETETRGGHLGRVRVTYDVEVVGTEVYGLVQARVACPRDADCGPEFFRGECAFQGAVEGNLICTDAGCQPPVCAPQEIIPDEGFADMSFAGDADLSGLCATEVTFSSDKTRLNPGDQTRISWTPTPNTGLVNIYLLKSGKK